MILLISRLTALSCVAIDIAIWTVDPHSIHAVAAWLCIGVLVTVMVGLILDRWLA